jgi:peptidoglycan/xylan/chitin deacetylase (PgdA/CDA1 family)
MDEFDNLADVNFSNENKPKNVLKKVLIITSSVLMTLLILFSISFYSIFAFFQIKKANAEPVKISSIDMPLYIYNEYTQKQNALKLLKDSTPINDEQYDHITNIYKLNSEKTVYLTFDDGPSPNITPLILDLLKQENIKATFFILGSNATYYPGLVKRAYNEGHYIANHGYSHRYSEIYENPETILNDYNLCNQALKKALNNENYESKVYRYPGGSTGGKYHDVKAEGKNLLKDNHIAYLDWNALTCDAEGTPTKESIMDNLRSTVGQKNTVVLLMHDSSSKILTYETLPEVIAFFRDNGYTFKNLYDVF